MKAIPLYYDMSIEITVTRNDQTLLGLMSLQHRSRNGPLEPRVSHGNARINFYILGPFSNLDSGFETGLCNNWENPNHYNTDNFRGNFHKAR
jgi:hypothetical protein